MAYTEAWLSANTLASTFSFSPDRPINTSSGTFAYKIPNFVEISEYMSYINTFPEVDSPEVLGLHPNADLTFRFKEVHQLLDTIVETQPKQSSGESGGKTREELVYEKCEELKTRAHRLRGGRVRGAHHRSRWLPSASQHLPLPRGAARLQAAIDKVRSTLGLVMQGIKGEIVVTGDILDSINAINDARVPKSWLYNPAGDEVSWISPTLGPGTPALLPVTRNTGRGCLMDAQTRTGSQASSTPRAI